MGILTSMQSAVWLVVLWGVLSGVLRSLGYVGAVPVTYCRDHLFNIRATLPPMQRSDTNLRHPSSIFVKPHVDKNFT